MSNLVKSSTAPLAPATTLRDVAQACDVDFPLASGDPRWQDFSSARGDHATEMLARDFEWRAPGSFVHAAFMGHRGAGKSTEIRRLLDRLGRTYEPVYIEATMEMHPLHIEVEDLLLTVAHTVVDAMRSRGTPLRDDLLRGVEKWFAEAVQTTDWAKGFNAEAAAGAEGKIGLPFVGSLFGSAKALFKYDSKYRTEVREVLRKYPVTLLASVNELLDEANKALGGRSLLVVVDNLDRYNPEIIDRLLVLGADSIRELRANLLLTPPISLLLKPKTGQLTTLYRCHTIHTVQLRSRHTPYDRFDGEGRDLMEKALAKRVDLDAMIPQTDARDRLIAASGGAIRELLYLVYRSTLVARGPAVLEEDVERAISLEKQRLRDSINVNGWLPALLTIAQEKQPSQDQKCMDVLFHQLAFKYNGDGWYDVHPLVTELPEFKNARDAGLR
jgi:hypothetical protein